MSDRWYQFVEAMVSSERLTTTSVQRSSAGENYKGDTPTIVRWNARRKIKMIPEDVEIRYSNFEHERQTIRTSKMEYGRD